MRTARALALFCLLGATTLDASAFAAEPPAKPVLQAMTAKARQLFAEGVKAYQQSRWADAHAAFFAAWALSKHYSIAGNLADCELKLGLHRDAAEHFALYAREMAKDASSTPEERKDGEARYAKARSKVGRADVKVSVPGAEVYLDGKRIGAAPMEDPLFLDPGSHTIEARSDGYPPARATIAAVAGAAQPVTLTLVREAEVPPIVPARRSVVPGAVLGSVAGAALVTGIGLFVAGRAKGSDVGELHDAILRDGRGCVSGQSQDPRCDDLQSAASKANAFQRAGVGLWIGAGAVAIGAAIYFALPSSARVENTKALRLVPAVSPGAAGLVLSGSL